MDGLPTQVAPRQHRLTVRDRQFVLIAMGGAAWLEWAEIVILTARQKAEAVKLCGDEEKLRENLHQLVLADAALVSRALGCDLDFALDLTWDERRAVIETQDLLNRMDLVLPALQVQALAHGVPVAQ